MSKGQDDMSHGEDPDHIVRVSLRANDPHCSGPNHGDKTALPRGPRRWTPAICLSLTQTVEDEDGRRSSHNTFCGPTCLCDWHGTFEGAMQSENDDVYPPGTFTLVWINPDQTSVATYEDWGHITEHIGSYQKHLIELGVI